MLELRLSPPDKDKVLFDVEFGLSEVALNEQKKHRSAGEIKTLLGKKNRLSIGEPEVWNLVELFEEKGSQISAEVKLMLNDYDFYQVRFACTFMPDENCKFVWARFGVKFSAVGAEEESESKLPVAYDMFPRDVYEEVKVKRDFSIGPNFKYKDFIQVGISGGSAQEFIRYEPEIISYGLLQADPCWDFQISKAKNFIIGSKELLMILKAPKGRKVEAKFDLSAEVHTFLGILPMIPVRIYKGDSLAEGKFIIQNVICKRNESLCIL
jgi:hypothetical protein